MSPPNVRGWVLTDHSVATAGLSTTPFAPGFCVGWWFQVLISVTHTLSRPFGVGQKLAKYEVLLPSCSAPLSEHGLLSDCLPLVRVMGGPRKTDHFVWSLLTVRNPAIYHWLTQTGYGLRHSGIIPRMVVSHHQSLNWVHEPDVQTCSSSFTEHDYYCNDPVISRVKLTISWQPKPSTCSMLVGEESNAWPVLLQSDVSHNQCLYSFQHQLYLRSALCHSLSDQS